MAQSITAREVELRESRLSMCIHTRRRDAPCICGSPWRHALERAEPKIIEILSETNMILKDCTFTNNKTLGVFIGTEDQDL